MEYYTLCVSLVYKGNNIRVRDEVLVPYMSKQKEELGLTNSAPGLCIFNAFAFHRCEEYLTKLGEHT